MQLTREKRRKQLEGPKNSVTKVFPLAFIWKFRHWEISYFVPDVRISKIITWKFWMCLENLWNNHLALMIIKLFLKTARQYSIFRNSSNRQLFKGQIGVKFAKIFDFINVCEYLTTWVLCRFHYNHADNRSKASSLLKFESLKFVMHPKGTQITKIR